MLLQDIDEVRRRLEEAVLRPGVSLSPVAKDIKALLAFTSWKRIELAPKDGTAILLWAGGVRIIGWWDAARDRWTCWPELHLPPPSHWMALAYPPPKEPAHD